MEYTAKSENINSYTEDYFKARFKRKLFGGYRPSEVIDFVNSLSSNFQNTDENLRKNILKLTQDKHAAIRELNELKSEKRNELQELKTEMDALAEELAEKNSILLSSEAVLEEAARKRSEDAGRFEETLMGLETDKQVLESMLQKELEKSQEQSERMHMLSEEMNQLKRYVEELENQNDETLLEGKLAEMKREAEAEVDEEKRISHNLRQEQKALESRLAEAYKANEDLMLKLYEEKNHRAEMEEALSQEKKRYAELQLSGFKKEFAGITQFLEELSVEQQARYRALELELQMEREKTEKAEERIENLLGKYGALKDKVLWEKKQFMAKLTELADGHSRFVSDFNLVLTEPTPMDSKEASNQ